MNTKYEVINGNGEKVNSTSEWIAALTSFHSLVQKNQAVMLWENDEIVQEYHPAIGHSP